MEIEAVDRSNGLIAVSFGGRFSETALAECLSRIRAPRLRGILLDVQNVDFRVPSDVMWSAARKLLLIELLLTTKVAFLANCTLAFGMLRILTSIMERRTEEVDVFTSRQSALSWLEGDTVVEVSSRDGLVSDENRLQRA